MRIDTELIRKIRAHGAREAPIEACGYLAGQNDTVTSLFPMRNVDASPEHFSFDPREQFAVVKEARAWGLKLLGTYHTHPETPARMSEEDKRLAGDPSARYVILSLLDQQIRCFRVNGEDFAEEPMEVVVSRFYDLPDSLEAEIESYAELVAAFLQGHVDSVKMKTTRVPMGVYEQREDGSYMTRIRVPGGDISPAQLLSLVDLASAYTRGPLHLTTRQDIQIHDVRLEDTPKLMRELIPLGLSTRGGGGNTVRNISGSWDSGFAEAEAFDVAPYVHALTTRMIAEPDSWTLPRKFKIAFSSTRHDTSYATVTDLGFIAALDQHGNRGFRVYAGGGMGTRPTLGILLYDFVPESDVYAISRAAKQLFDAHGNRKDRNAARMRFLLLNWGEERFRAEFEEMLTKVRAENPEPLRLDKWAGATYPGYVEVPVFLGDLTYTAARAVARIAEPFGPESLRLTPRQNLVIKNIPANSVTDVKRQLEEAGLVSEETQIHDNAVACAGASTCRLGICLSRDLVRAVAAQARAELSGGGRASDLRINVSGCPNSCGQHLLGDLGFFGGAVRRHGHQVPAYNVVLGGRTGDGDAHLADPVGRVPAKNVPGFVHDLVKLINATRQDGERFLEYFTRERASVVALVEKHSEVAPPSEDPAAYIDWGADTPFSVLRKQGECASGVVDLIRRDFENADNALKRYNELGDGALLQQAVESAANALLITRGIEARSGHAAVELFLQHFGAQVGSARVAADAYLSGALTDPSPVQAFVAAVKQAYDAMDTTLGHLAASKIATPATAIARERDLRGVACPMNFVKTKLVLEELEHGDVLKVLLDDGPPIENVPASVAAEGHEVLEQTRQDDHWLVLIRKNAA